MEFHVVLGLVIFSLTFAGLAYLLPVLYLKKRDEEWEVEHREYQARLRWSRKGYRGS